MFVRLKHYPSASRHYSSSRIAYLNVNFAVDKEHESKSLNEIARLPPSALQGIAPHTDEILSKLRLKTIRGIGAWKYFHLAKAIKTLAEKEESGGRKDDFRSNINKAIDKKYEKLPLRELLKLPPSAISGLAVWTDEVFELLHIKTIEHLATWKYAHWAEAISVLSDMETEPESSS
jgi:hypothetical protein